MNKNLYSILFCLAFSPVFADSPSDSSRVTPPTPLNMPNTSPKLLLPDSIQQRLNHQYGIIPLDYLAMPRMPKIFSDPCVDAKIIKIMPQVNEGILDPDSKKFRIKPQLIKPSDEEKVKTTIK